VRAQFKTRRREILKFIRFDFANAKARRASKILNAGALCALKFKRRDISRELNLSAIVSCELD